MGHCQIDPMATGEGVGECGGLAADDSVAWLIGFSSLLLAGCGPRLGHIFMFKAGQLWNGAELTW